MNDKKTILLAMALPAAGLVGWVACRVLLDTASPATVILCALLICAILVGVLVLSRRLPAAVRKQGLKHASVIGLSLVLAFLAYSWRQGQFRDAILFLPLAVLVVLLALGPLFVLSWAAISLILGSARPQAPGGDSSGPFFGSRLAGGLFTFAVVACLVLFLLIPWIRVLSFVDLARVTRMKSRNRGIWVSLVAASDERASAGLPPLWPRDLGFTGSESSTAYFRRLLSNEAGRAVEWLEDQIAPDLKPFYLNGPGLPKAASAEAFGPENHAWQVVCIGEDAPVGVPFLISRNVDFGDTLTPTSQVRFIRSGPLRLRRVVWLTRGGGTFDAPFRVFEPAMLFRDIYDDSDPAATSAVYRVMRP